MAGWFSRSGPSTFDEAPQPFELSCECGTTHTGLRRRVFQRVVCHTCGKSLFLLPKDVYPRPQSPKKRSRKRTSADPLLDVQEIVMPADPAEQDHSSEEKPSWKSRHQRRRENRQSAADDVPVEQLVSASDEKLPPSIPSKEKKPRREFGQQSWLGRVLDWWTPLKMTVVAISAVLVATFWWSIHHRRIEQAQRELNPAVEAGFTALERGDLETAHQELTRAVAALDVIGTSDHYAAQVRQVHRETTALSNLLAVSLIEIVEEADALVEQEMARRKSLPSKGEEDQELPPLDADWQHRFGGLYRGAWIVLEGPVEKKKGPEPSWQVHFPVAIGPRQRSVEFHADFKVWTTVGKSTSEPTWILAGPLKSCYLSEDGKRWVVELDQESGLLWANMATYRMLGFPFGPWHPLEEVRQQLDRQRELLKLEPLPFQIDPESVEPALREGLT